MAENKANLASKSAGKKKRVSKKSTLTKKATTKKPTTKKATTKKKGAKKVTANQSTSSTEDLKPAQAAAISVEPDSMVNTQSAATISDAPGNGVETSKDKPQDTSAVTAQSSGAETSSSSVMAWIALILSVLAFGSGGYAWYVTAIESKLTSGQQESRFNVVEQRLDGFENSQNDSASQISSVKNQIAQSEDNFSNQIRAIRKEITDQDSLVKQQLSGFDQNMDAQSESYRQEFETLSNTIVILRSELGRSIDSWTLEEAEQLIFVAQQRLEFAGDVVLAKRALELAAERLDQLADPGVADIQRLLTADILALGSVDIVDPSVVLNKLSGLSENIYLLPLAGDVAVPASSESESGGQETLSDDQQSEGELTSVQKFTKPIMDGISALIDSLGDLVQVEKNGKSVKPLISAEARQLTYDKVNLILESAQIAFVRQQVDLYKNRIQTARLWVEERFDQNSTATINWLGELGKLEAISPDSNLPDLTKTLEAISQLILSRN